MRLPRWATIAAAMKCPRCHVTGLRVRRSSYWRYLPFIKLFHCEVCNRKYFVFRSLL